jgi:hypothetical protein
MSDEALKLLSAPWDTILTLSSGYIGYYVAHVGIREHHRGIDQVFRVVLYGFFGIFVYYWLRYSFDVGILSASLASLIMTFGLGAFWRRWGRAQLEKALRAGRISQSDDTPTAWMALAEAGDHAVATQLKVRLSDGTRLFCENLAAFKSHPNGPCVLGGNGDVLIYVTHEAKGSSKEYARIASIDDELHGTMITYVPREQIARIEFRRMRR